MLTATALWVAPMGPVPAVEERAVPATSAAAPALPAPAVSAVAAHDPTAPARTGRASVAANGPVAGFADVRTWPKGRVTWAMDVPKRYRWSVRQAVKAWNRTHTGVRFVRRPWTRADLWITVGDTDGAAARATIGYSTSSRITVQRTRLPDWTMKQLYGRVVTHELGHVLGLEHTGRGQCGIMLAVLDASCSPEPDGDRFSCRWIDRGVGRMVAARYGGSFRAGPRTCALPSGASR